MEILTERLKISELSVSDVSDISKIAQDMAWNDTLNLLIREDIDEATFIHYNKSTLYSYKQKLYDSGYLDVVSELYKKVPQSFIPEENWHINFSQLPPPFEENARKFIDGAMKRKNEQPRQGFWMAIRELGTDKIIGGISISTRILRDDEGKNKI